MKRRLLLAAHPTAGHTGALRAIGNHLRREGHETAFSIQRMRLPLVRRWPAPVRVAAELPAAIEAEGFELLPLSFSAEMLWHGALLPTKTGLDELGGAIRLFTSGAERQAREIASHASRFRADAVVGDYLMPAAMLGASLARVPYVAVYHSALPFPAEGDAPFGSRLPASARGTEAFHAAQRSIDELWSLFDERVAATARALGLPPPRRGLMSSPISRDLNLLATVPALEPGLGRLEGPVEMIGPCRPRPAAGQDEGHPALDIGQEDGLRVYVSLGTVFNGKPAVFSAILDGLAELGARAVVSAGASYEALQSRSGPRTRVFRDVPQVALLPKVDVVVTHGGNNTVQECLSAGRPMVVVPFGSDQIMNASRVERLSVGTGIQPSELTPRRVREAVERAAKDATEKARALGEALRDVDGARDGARAILRFLDDAERRPAAT